VDSICHFHTAYATLTVDIMPRSGTKKHKPRTRQPFFKRHRKLLFITGGSIVAAAAIFYLLYTFAFIPVKHPDFGVTFSKERAKEFGLDWRANYLALLDDMKLKHFRLMSYWDAHEPIRSQFNFTDLDWMMDQAARRGATVSLAIGLRQPRWPECHQPDWSLTLKGNEWKQSLYAYMEVVAKRYRNNPALESWQLENEGVNTWFGKCEVPDYQRLHEEFDLLKQWDPRHPVIMTLSDEHGIPVFTPVPDEYGFSVYRIVYNTFGPHVYIVFPTPIWYHRLRAAFITMIYHKPIIIHELQMEPWGPADTNQLSIAEQNKSMSPAQIAKNFDFAERLGLQKIDLWGGEWWYWRKVHFGDNSIWDAVKAAIQAGQNQ
jgi:hypothetical protein